MGTTPYPVPTSEADVTPEWMAAVLGSPVREFTAVERVGVDYGFASQLFRFAWDDGAVARSVVVKLWSTDDRAGDRETAFYRELAPALPIRLATCHHAGSASGRAVLVLDDLAPTRQGDVLEPLDAAAASRLVAVAAGLHSATAGSSTTAAPWLAPRRPGRRADDWFASRREAFLERFGPPPDPVVRRLLDRFPVAQERAFEVLSSVPDVILHGDLHLDNVLFVGEDPVLVDWANCGPGPAVLDLVAVVFRAGPPGWFRNGFSDYRAALGDRAGAVLGDTPLDDQVGAALLFELATWTLAVAKMRPPVRVEMVEAGVAGAYRVARDWYAYSSGLFDEALG